MQKIFKFYQSEDVTIKIQATTLVEAKYKLSSVFGLRHDDASYIGEYYV